MKDWMKAATSGAVGAVTGARTWVVVGNMGLAAMGTATAVTVGPFVAIGAGVGLTEYGLYWLRKQVGSGNKTSKP